MKYKQSDLFENIEYTTKEKNYLKIILQDLMY